MHGTAAKKDPRCTMTSMSIKTAFDAARTKHIANNLGEQDTHGWITGAFYYAKWEVWTACILGAFCEQVHSHPLHPPR